MPVYKRTYRSGQTAWHYVLDAPGSTRENRQQITGSGFATKHEAQDAEAKRRTEELQKQELAKLGRSVVGPLPRTLSMLMDEFFRQHVDEKLAPKTVERYHEQAAYLGPELLNMQIGEIAPLHLSREWNRLLACGGHHRRTREPRPLSPKTVRNVAGIISSAFARAIKWGLVTTNPVTASEPPVPKKHRGMALTPAQQKLVCDTASGPWCLAAFLEMCAGTGARRGEVLALRWSDIHDDRVLITRSLTQTKEVLEFKCTKTEDSTRPVSLAGSTLAALEAHRRRQDEFRQKFGPDYRTDLDLIFANPDGTPLKPDSVSATVSALCRRLKLPKGASLHTMRHSHGSQLIAAGVDLATVSERLGHSNVRVTAEIYAHAIRGRDDEAARKWDEFRRQNLPENRAEGVQ
jgi:integrase